jgi:hypothetical protein
MGGLIQLVAYGAQDIYLTGTPEMTYFKSVFRRHTHFSIESIKQTIDGNISTSESKVSTIISRSGDLLSNIWIEAELPPITSVGSPSYTHWCNNTSSAFLKECSIDIGGQQIDKHNSLWHDIYNELNIRDKNTNTLLNKHNTLNYRKSGNNTIAPRLHLLIPLYFWFCRNSGSALPLIALQYHEVTLNLTLRGLDNLIITDTPTGSTNNTPPIIEVWCDYIFLAEEERKRFAQSKHTYLIEQLQIHDEEIIGNENQNIELFFNHPIKELLWVFTDDTRTSEINTINTAADPSTFSPVTLDDLGTTRTIGTQVTGGHDYFNYQVNFDSSIISSIDSGSGIGGDNHMENFGSMMIKLNGHHRFEARKAVYFRTIQPIQAKHEIPRKHIYCYSFALNPNEFQPSGSCNFSRIDTAELEFSNLGNTTRTVHVYSIGYNILQIVSGLGGLAFAH